MTLRDFVYHEEDGITLYCGDARDVMRAMECTEPCFEGCWTTSALSVMVTDPPYGIAYKSGAMRAPTTPDSIEGDQSTAVRDDVLFRWGDKPALVFGSWKAQPPKAARAMLVWDQDGALGMGALDLPWKPSWQAIYVLGRGFAGRRDGGVLRCPPVQSMAYNGRQHPHEKPVRLLRALLAKCPEGGVFDPFAGSGSTLVAAKLEGRHAVGIEIDRAYCAIAKRRLAQGVLFSGASPGGSAPAPEPGP